MQPHQAFVEIAQTGKRHNVAPLSLADALVAIASNQSADHLDPRAVCTAHETWGYLLDGHRSLLRVEAITSANRSRTSNTASTVTLEHE